MRDLCAAFNRPLNDDLVRVYWEALKGFPLPQIRSGVKKAAANEPKFPPPYKLRPAEEQIVPNTFTPLPDKEDIDAYEQWGRSSIVKFLVRGDVRMLSDDELRELLPVRDRLVAQFREIGKEETVRPEEFLKAAFKAYERAIAA